MLRHRSLALLFHVVSRITVSDALWFGLFDWAGDCTGHCVEASLSSIALPHGVSDYCLGLLSGLLSRITVSDYCLGLLSRITVSDYCLGFLSRIAVSDYCLGLLFRITVSDYCFGLLPPSPSPSPFSTAPFAALFLLSDLCTDNLRSV